MSPDSWRASAADALQKAGMVNEAIAFAECGNEASFRHVDVCASDLDHVPVVVPFTCHKRYCPDCEPREQARKLARYIPAVYDAYDAAPDDYSLKKIELTTPYNLRADDAPERFIQGWKDVTAVLQRVFYKVLEPRLSKSEKRRQRVDLRRHGIGIIAQAEFGEKNQHLHYHLLLIAPFISKHFLTEAWREVTGGECYVTWIKKIPVELFEDAVKEQVKYITKFTSLDPALIPQLARVLDGQHRTHLYGTFVRLPKVARVAKECPICSSNRRLLTINAYIALCQRANKPLDNKVIAAYEAKFAGKSSIALDLKHGNCVGERAPPTTANSPPIVAATASATAPAQQTKLLWSEKTKRFEYF